MLASLLTNLMLYMPSEIYLDSNNLSDDNNLEVPWHKLVREVNSAKAKRDGDCIYYQNSLPLKLIDIQFENECEITISGKVCNFLYLYRLSSQTRYVLEILTDNFELFLNTLTNQNRFLIFALGDYNAKITGTKTLQIVMKA